MLVIIRKSLNPNKKFDAIFDDKIISFGDVNYEDYTMHHDDLRKERYIDRHSKRENYNMSGIKTAGFLSRYILWNKKSVEDSIKFLNNKYKNIEFILK